ncbi:MAG: mannonate dehydratase [Reichenbachiella sp.]|uniref:mannonate dehydratase n=3 Tax=Reichenbachiella sp. TaxID=2184521 RepID=UPI0032657C6A
MSLFKTWRWYGPNDIVSLDDIQQTGVSGIVTALHHILVGEVWSVEEIQKRKKNIEWDEAQNRPRNLVWSVVESVNIHESIKKGLPERDIYINNYILTLKNLANEGIKTVCYNFMPVLDWTRTDLDFEIAGGGKALRYDTTRLAAFDLYILERSEAKEEYDETMKSKARDLFLSLTPQEKDLLQRNILAGVPGSGSTMSLDEFKVFLDGYKNIDAAALKNNLAHFLQKVIPEAEKLGIKMCCHPDDPPYPIFGLPRVISNESDLEYLTQCIDSPSNGITFCTGSLGPDASNDLSGIIKRLGHKFHFIHLRNVQREVDGSFYEAHHLGGSVDMYGVIKALTVEMNKRKAAGRDDYEIPMRPDHGHQMLDDLDKTIPFPGYSAIGRLKGLAELCGLELGIQRSNEALNK